MRKNVSWEQIQNFCEILSKDIRKRKAEYDTLLAITRGGLAPAAILSHILEISDVRTIGVRSYDNTTQKEEIELIQQPNPYMFVGKRVLVIDDIIQSGITMSLVFKFFKVIIEQDLAEFSSAVLIYKGPSPYPDYFGTKVDPDTWVDFPWEV